MTDSNTPNFASHDKLDPYGAFIARFDPPMAGAKEGPLKGLTFAAKDNYDVKGYVTGAGNPDWAAAHGPAKAHSDAVERLLAAGADLVGKAHTVELARGIFGENSHYGTPVNPAAPDRVPGGSSSGSVAAVSGKLCDFALGTDTGGSVRVPAAFTGLYGMRTTQNRISFAGGVSLGPSFDTVGWFARDAATFERVGKVMLKSTGPEPSLPKKLHIATDAFAAADPEVTAALKAPLDLLKSRIGASSDIRIAGDEGLGRWMRHQTVLQGLEGWDYFKDWFDGCNPRIGYEVAVNFIKYAEFPDDEIAAAKAARPRIRKYVNDLLADGSVLAFPTAAILPPKRGQSRAVLQPLRPRLLTITCISGMSSCPQINLPLANIGGVPVGLSLLAAEGGDELLMRIAASL